MQKLDLFRPQLDRLSSGLDIFWVFWNPPYSSQLPPGIATSLPPASWQHSPLNSVPREAAAAAAEIICGSSRK
jgi:hypothetical protein